MGQSTGRWAVRERQSWGDRTTKSTVACGVTCKLVHLGGDVIREGVSVPWVPFLGAPLLIGSTHWVTMATLPLCPYTPCSIPGWLFILFPSRTLKHQQGQKPRRNQGF